MAQVAEFTEVAEKDNEERLELTDTRSINCLKETTRVELIWGLTTWNRDLKQTQLCYKHNETTRWFQTAEPRPLKECHGVGWRTYRENVKSS